jgi:hypothetical protein
MAVMKTKGSDDGRSFTDTTKVARLVPRLRLVPPLRSGVLNDGVLQAPDDMPPIVTISDIWKENE